MALDSIQQEFTSSPKPAGRGAEWPSQSDFASKHSTTRILIIEDEIMIAWMIESALSEAGFTEILITADGYQAQRLATDTRPELIISDVNLGAGLDGVEASIAIVRDVHIPVIFITAYANAAVRARIQSELPTAQLLRKPLDTTALLEAIRRTFRESGNN